MLAANPRSNNSLGLLLLILGLVYENRQNEIPERLQTRVVDVLRQAAHIAGRAAITGEAPSAEALELALELRSENVLNDELSRLQNFAGIRPALARRLLDRLGGYSVFAE